MNAELQALKERRSVRKYKADMVPQELIDQVSMPVFMLPAVMASRIRLLLRLRIKRCATSCRR